METESNAAAARAAPSPGGRAPSPTRSPGATASDRTNARSGSVLSGIAVLSGAALAALAAYNRVRTIAAEAANPPRGRLLEVDGVTLHVVEVGPPDAPPVVLLHGNVITLEDWFVSGVVERLRGHRVILFDRPGYGFSERPRGRAWTIRDQAALLREACRLLGAERPVVVGQSHGAMVALAWGLDAPASVAGLVLVSGYYFPTRRPDAMFVAPAAVPVLGPLLRNTVSPPFTRAALPTTLRVMFAPQDVPEAYYTEFPLPLVSRPGQIRAIASDGSRIAQDAAWLEERLPTLAVPAAVIAGDEDRVVSTDEQSRRLAGAIGAPPEIVPGAGHTVHHAAPDRVAAAVDRIRGRVPPRG